MDDIPTQDTINLLINGLCRIQVCFMDDYFYMRYLRYFTRFLSSSPDPARGPGYRA